VTAVGDIDHVSTTYGYADGPRHVTAQGGWFRSPSWGFSMRMFVEFEEAVADFALGRDPELRVCLASGETEIPDLEPGTGWQGEIVAMVRAVRDSALAPPATMASAVVSTRVLEAERESLRTGGPIALENA